MNEFIEQFIIESRDYVEQALRALAVLETSPREAQALEELFRALHTLKGSAGIVDFVPMERLLHQLESVLTPTRTGGAALAAELNEDGVAALDLVTRWLDAMEQSGALPTDAEREAAALMAQPGSAGREPEAGAPGAQSGTTLPHAARQLLEAQVALLGGATGGNFPGHVASAGRAAANVLTACGLPALAERIARAAGQSVADKNPRHLQQQLDAALRDAAQATPASADIAPRADGATRTLRIDAGRVEMLVRLIGELTVVKNAIGHTVSLAQGETHPLSAALKEQHAALERITTEVQGAVLGMRVLPLRTVFGRFPAIVREMSSRLGKPARLAIEGDDTEADKAIVEMLFEPLLHVVRNALDHGIESPADRARGNKPATATLGMRAARHGDHVFIEVSDDGGGIDPARVRVAALQRGVITADALAAMSEDAVIDLVFAPGFSTAAEVTELSGRGVGMDAVRTAVSRIGGTVAIDSRLGGGTTVRLSLPFSVMMTQVMTVEASGQTFGIPLDAVIETIRVPVSALSGVGAAHAIAHRDRTLPVFELGSLLHVNAAPAAASEAVIVVVKFAGQWGGIRVDRPGERMEVMLKPLDGLLAGIPGVTGTTIMGDGKVLLVLDLGAILS